MGWVKYVAGFESAASEVWTESADCTNVSYRYVPPSKSGHRPTDVTRDVHDRGKSRKTREVTSICLPHLIRLPLAHLRIVIFLSTEHDIIRAKIDLRYQSCFIVTKNIFWGMTS